MTRIGARLLLPSALALLVGCDHATKHIAKTGLAGDQPRALIGGVLDLRYVENTDVGFNLLHWVPETARAPILIVMGAIALVGLALLVLRPHARNPLRRAALLLITAGALGNYIDRIARGYVIDFVHLHHWPVFNIADVYLTIGLGVLLLSGALVRRSLPET